MKTVEILAGFTGYPNGKRRHFAKGDMPEIADAYADVIVGQGLARETAAAATPPKADPAKAKD